jgi:hypothetical protein
MLLDWLGGQDGSLRTAAVERLTDQAFLAKIAGEANDSSVRSAADGRLACLALLAGIGAEDVGKLTDQALLAKIAVDGRDASIREMADVTLAVLQTAELSVSDRVRGNWPKLRKDQLSPQLPRRTSSLFRSRA